MVDDRSINMCSSFALYGSGQVSMASLSFICFLILCSYYSIAAAGDGHQSHRFAVVSTSSFEPQDVCSTSRVTPGSNRAAVPLAHRHGPCAPSRYTTDMPSFAETLRKNRARAGHIIRRASRGISKQDDGTVSIPTYLGSSVDSLEYVVMVSLGTPAVPQVLLIDTGSDLSWVQCQPCNASECYPQKDPLFDPSKSSSYAPVPCKSDACKNLTADGYDNGCTNDALCGYAIQYGGGSTTTGVYSTETMTLEPGVPVKNFSFGCGNDQHGPYDKFDGLLGLGGAPESLVVQTSAAYGGAFSYCLPPVSSNAGFLALGAPTNTAGFVYTPMGRDPNQATFYVVKLTGVSVGGKQLNIPSPVLSGGLIVDSGTVVTEIPSSAYKALKSAFRAAMAAYPRVPNVDLDTCYNLTGYKNVTVPRVALAFSGGATIDLDIPNGVLVDGCLAFDESGPDGSVGILGNVNQRTFEVLYDAGRGTMGFRGGAC